MRDPTPSNLLAAWEQGLNRSAVERALILLAAALPGTAPGRLAQLPVGQRDSVLLALRERVFGPRLVSRAACPGCGERLEMDFKVSAIRVIEAETPGKADSSDDLPPPGHVLSLEFNQDGYAVRFRLPNSLDMLAVAGAGDLDSARITLLERCVLEARRDGLEIGVRGLPEAVTSAMAARMAESDPQADVRLALTCPACGRAWQAAFDIGAFFWEELNGWALRTLREVHLLASAYGWKEADILALSPARRQVYLEMVQA